MSYISSFCVVQAATLKGLNFFRIEALGGVRTKLINQIKKVYTIPSECNVSFPLNINAFHCACWQPEGLHDTQVIYHRHIF